MSYILEGLKKLEQKRKKEEETRGILFSGEEVLPTFQRPILWPYLLFIALLLNAGIIVWWIAPWRSVPPRPLLSKQSERPAPAAAVDQKKPVLSISKKALPPGPVINKPEDSLPRAAKKPTERKNIPIAVPDSPGPQPPEKSKAATEGTIIVKTSELPAEIKNSLPPLKMSLHYYHTEKPSRFVIINNRNLQEGGLLSEGLKVVEITPEGVVFQYRGHRFLLGINESN
jgi:general secretion pathway protein B